VHGRMCMSPCWCARPSACVRTSISGWAASSARRRRTRSSSVSPNRRIGSPRRRRLRMTYEGAYVCVGVCVCVRSQCMDEETRAKVPVWPSQTHGCEPQRPPSNSDTHRTQHRQTQTACAHLFHRCSLGVCMAICLCAACEGHAGASGWAVRLWRGF
jgi:hypothetical protein